VDPRGKAFVEAGKALVQELASKLGRFQTNNHDRRYLMSAGNYDQSIDRAQRRVEQSREKAEALVKLHQEAAGAFLVEWADYLVERSLSDKPHVAKGLGQEKLAEMKSKFNEILDGIREMATARVDDAVFWPHREEIGKETESNITLSYDLTKRKNEAFHEILRYLIGQVGTLLIEYGFAETGSGSEWRPGDAGKIRYSYGLPTYGVASSEQLGRANEEYGKVVEELVAATKELRQAQHAKEASEAKKLWDNA